jgi:restriction system protein
MATTNKRERKANGPEFIRFFQPILEVLKELGGSGNAGEIVDSVVDRMNISDTELSVLNKNGGSRIKNQVAWARMYLVHFGAIDNATRGVWALTDKGQKLSINNHDDAIRIFKEISAGQKTGADNSNAREETILNDSGDLENEAESRTNHRDKLISLLRTLPPAGFEKICQRLLRESGFKKVIVTGKSGDGGIDGEGILEINPLITFKVLFQCKRYKDNNPIGPSTIRDFRGVMQGRADKGIILTTSNFTKDAKKEAIRDGAPPIELVDADGIVDLFESKELGLKPIKIYEIDEQFFNEYKNG